VSREKAEKSDVLRVKGKTYPKQEEKENIGSTEK